MSELGLIIVSSNTEIFLQKFVAPALISRPGKVIVLLLYASLTAICILKVFDVRTYFSMELFVNEEYGSYDFLQARDKYFG